MLPEISWTCHFMSVCLCETAWCQQQYGTWALQKWSLLKRERERERRERGERERERERERQTETETERDRDKQAQRQTYI